MSIETLVAGKGFKNFMAKLYGWGASVVIVGALFKIQHYPGAGPMLVVGLSVEAIIFFFSAFEPPHEEPDWSLVYPELGGHDSDMLEEAVKMDEEEPQSISQQLDKMLKEANIDSELLTGLSKGLTKLSDGASKLSDVTEAATATNEYVGNLHAASSSVKELKESYNKTSEVLNKDLAVTDELVSSIKAASNSANELSGSYVKASEALINDISASKEYSTSIKNVTASANELAEQYKVSTERLVKSVDSIDLSSLNGKTYVAQLEQISNSLTALNSVYELQLKNSNKHSEITVALNESVDKLRENLDSSVHDTLKFKEELSKLNEHLSSLNNVYGNMLSAMSIKK